MIWEHQRREAALTACIVLITTIVFIAVGWLNISVISARILIGTLVGIMAIGYSPCRKELIRIGLMIPGDRPIGKK